MNVAGQYHYLAKGPDFDWENCPMKFRLTYEGRLEGNGSADHKHEIRRAFHPQLKRLWAIDPNLSKWHVARPPDSSLPPVGLTNRALARDALAQSFERIGYNFVPLATERMSLLVGLEILFLRPDTPGGVLKSGDIDNRLKTLFDALKMPGFKEELGRYSAPSVDEDPFYVLLEDDRLLSHVAVETDVLLGPTPTANGQFLPNDCRIMITVAIRPYTVWMDNLHFA